MKRGIARLRDRLADEAGFGLVEVVVAVVISAVGLVGMAGLAVAVAAHTDLAGTQTDQALAAQEVLERIQELPYGAIANRTDTVAHGGRRYTLNSTVTVVRTGLKEVQVDVRDRAGRRLRTYRTRVYQTRQLPLP